MKNKKYHNVKTVLKYKRKIIETNTPNMTAHFSGLAQAPQ